MKFSEIPKLTNPAHYRVNHSWSDLQGTIERYQKHTRTANLDLNPDFQRGHVWTRQQKINFVEYKLRGGEGSNVILLNCPGWMNSFKGPFQLVDGKQRIQAVLDFLDNKIPAFETYFSQFEDRIPFMIADFIFCVNNLETRAEVLQWYLELNSGGTPHTEAELEKVNNMLKGELK